MSLVIEDKVLEQARITEAELKLEIAILLYQMEKFTLGQASRFAGLSQFKLQHHLAGRGINTHYDVDDFEEDLETIGKSSNQ